MWAFVKHLIWYCITLNKLGYCRGNFKIGVALRTEGGKVKQEIFSWGDTDFLSFLGYVFSIYLH